MTRRELKALDTDCCLPFRTRSGKTPRPAMADTPTFEQQLRELQTQLEGSQALLLDRDLEVQRLRSVAEKASAEAAEALSIANAQASTVSSLQQELDSLTIRSELAKFRALEELRSEHKTALEREASLRVTDQKRADTWIQDLKESHRAEKEHLVQRITVLE